MQTLTSQSSESPGRSSDRNALLSIESFVVYAVLILLVSGFLSSPGWDGKIVGCFFSGCILFNILFFERAEVMIRNRKLVIHLIVAGVAYGFFMALMTHRPLAYAKRFFEPANVEYQTGDLSWSFNEPSILEIEIGSEEFEKLLSFYREKSGTPSDSLSYFALAPESLKREDYLDSRYRFAGWSFDERMVNPELPKDFFVPAHHFESRIENLMKGFPEVGENLGTCRVITSYNDGRRIHFFWFEKIRKGYVFPFG